MPDEGSKKKSNNLVVKTRVYEIVKADEDGEDMQLSGKLFSTPDEIGPLDKIVEKIILEAKRRAIQNKRKTIFPRDL